MASLNGQTIASSYEQLLHVDADGGGNANTLVSVKDGDNGTTFGIKLATNKVEIIPSAADDAAAFEVSKNNGTPVFTVNTSTAGFALTGNATITGDEQAFTVTTGDSGRVGIVLQNSTTGADTDFTDGLVIKLDSDESGQIGMAENTALNFMTNGSNRLVIKANGSLVSNPAGTGNTVFGDDSGIALDSNNNHNTFFGFEAGKAVHHADNNVFIGSGAGVLAEDTIQAVAIGKGALDACTTGGHYNIAIGTNVLASTTTGEENVAIGDSVALNMTNTSNCVLIGSGAGLDINSNGADGTVAIGKQSGANITSGAENVAVGMQSLLDLTTGGANVAVGFKAAQNLALGESHNISIGSNSMENLKENHANAEANHNIAIGSGTLAAGNLGDGVNFQYNIAIGSNALNSTGTTQHEGTIAIGYNAGTAINAEAAEGSIFIGHEAGDAATSGAANVGVGYQSLSGAMGSNCSYNTAFGHQAGKAIAGNSNSNVAIGTFAMQNAAECDRNVAIGYNAAGTFDDGQDQNVVIGYRAGADISVAAADSNVLIGFEAGIGGSGDLAGAVVVGANALKGTGGNNSTGQVAIGADSLTSVNSGTNNVAVGYQTGFPVTTGNHNTLIGHLAGRNLGGGASHTTLIGMQAGTNMNTSGDTFNVCIGSEAGDVITSGVNNTIIGTAADPSAAGGTNQIVIGYGVAGQGDNFAVIGNGSTTRLYIADDQGGQLFAGTSTINTSDKRIKKDIEDSNLGLDFINKLRPVNYKKREVTEYDDSLKKKMSWYKNNTTPRVLEKEQKEKTRVGFIAQEVGKVLKDLGFADNNEIIEIDKDTTQQGLAYERFVPSLVKAVQELSAKVEQLENKLGE